MTGVVGEGRAMDIGYLDFSNDFSTVSCNIIIDILLGDGLGKWSMQWNRKLDELLG